MPLKGRSNVDKAIAMIQAGANDDVKGVYLAGMKNMIEGTPARTGGTRNSWQLSVGSPRFVYNESTGSAEKATPSKGSTSGASKSIMSAVNDMPDNVLGKTLYFTNGSPAIHSLEYGGYPDPVALGTWIDGKYQKLSRGGYSKQTKPGGWVRKNLKLMRNKIRSLK